MYWRNILLIIIFSGGFQTIRAQKLGEPQIRLIGRTVFEGDTITWLELPVVYVFKPLVFKNKKEEVAYSKLIRDVKRTLPIAHEINQAIIETYEYMQTLPNKKARDAHMKSVEKSLKQQYTPRMKRLTFSQGKLLIKLVDRQSNSTTYELVKAFMGPFKAGLYQTFASLFGASLRKEYDPNKDDVLTERVVLLIESGQL
jgi:hypothetical protein